MGNVSRANSFVDGINKKLGSRVLFKKDDTGATSVPRFSSQILSLDMALGGGWPHGRVVLLTGLESTAKTLLALKATESITNYDHTTKMHKDYVNPERFEPGIALFVDAEATFDIDWADKVANFSNYDHVVARPETSEEAIDIISSAMEENCFDLIILDSLAVLTPQKIIESSAQDQFMGLNARMNNRALSVWNSRLLKWSRNRSAPTLMVINQIREKIGVMFGNPETLPGGKQQNYSSSITVRQGTAKIESGEVRENSLGTYRGTIPKNKTATAKQAYTFQMFIADDKFPAGHIDNLSEIKRQLKRFNLLESSGGKWSFTDENGTLEASRQKDLIDMIGSDPEVMQRLYRSILFRETGYHDGKVQLLGQGQAAEAEDAEA